MYLKAPHCIPFQQCNVGVRSNDIFAVYCPKSNRSPELNKVSVKVPLVSFNENRLFLFVPWDVFVQPLWSRRYVARLVSAKLIISGISVFHMNFCRGWDLSFLSVSLRWTIIVLCSFYLFISISVHYNQWEGLLIRSCKENLWFVTSHISWNMKQTSEGDDRVSSLLWPHTSYGGNFCKTWDIFK